MQVFLATNKDWQDKVEVGHGWSYGAELFIQKKIGRTTGWIGYTLSWTERKFDGLNSGRTFPYRYDRRHDLSFVLTHKFKPTLDIGLTWVYGTGNAVTLATSQFRESNLYDESSFGGFFDERLSYYGDRNSYRMAPYHRFDIAFNWHRDRAWFSRKGKSTLSLSVYNAYNRKNPFFIYAANDLRQSEISVVGSTDPGYRQISLFPILPSISYTFHF